MPVAVVYFAKIVLGDVYMTYVGLLIKQEVD